MARARNIKPGFFTDGALSKVSIPARYLFSALWCMADREGRLVESIEDIELFAFPRDRVDVDALLGELAPRFITRYEIDGQRFIQVIHFKRHQNPHPHEKPSEIPPPPDSDSDSEMSRHVSDKPLHSTSSPAESLIPDSPIPDSGFSDSLIADSHMENEGTRDASAPPPAPDLPGKPKRQVFKPPTLEEVKAYCDERRNRVDPQRFIDFYQANGWKVGKNPMKDWKAAVRTWEARGEDVRGHPSKAQKPFDPFSIPNTPDRYAARADDFGDEFMRRLEGKK